jgi:GH25 family lysozyme M1 (1,4-beta-N-acetylmuramidase)
MQLGRRVAVPTALALLLVTMIPLGAGFASATSSRWAANCSVNVRSRPSTAATKRTIIAEGTVVTVSGKVSGGWYSSTCKTSVSGSSWFAITAIGSRSVSSLYGVSTVYAASLLFRAVTTTTTTTLYGIDVSRWQGRIDFARVRASGKRFVFAKATEGRIYTDDAYTRNRSAALAAGLVFGAYHFAHPDRTANDAILEADNFVNVAGLRHGMLRPVLDLESGQTLGVSGLQWWVKTWLARVYTRTGARAMIYTTPAFWKTYMGDTRWFANNGYRVVWVAHWSVASPTVPASNWSGRSWSFWQYSNCGTVSGIAGCVDLDRFRGSDLSVVKF